MWRGKILPLFLILCLGLVGCSTSAVPSVDQIKADLIGHRLTFEGYHVWTFAALSEYEEFDIRSEQTQGDIIEYDVSMRLHDLATDEHFLADALIVYKQTDGEWEITSIVTKLYQQLY